MGVSCLYPRPAPPPAQLEQLAGRAQRASGHRALPAWRSEQPVRAAAGGAVSGWGTGRRGGDRESEWAGREGAETEWAGHWKGQSREGAGRLWSLGGPSQAREVLT